MRFAHLPILRSVLTAVAALACAITVGNASAASFADLGLSQAQAQALLDSLSAPAGSPGIAFGSPIGFGIDAGELSAAVGGETLSDELKFDSDNLDGSTAFGAGLGDAQKFIGFEGVVNIISLRDSFGDSGSFNYKFHTNLPGRSAVAVGVENVGRWGPASTTKSSVYAAGTKFFDLGPITLGGNLGVGDQRFQRPSKNGGANVFGGVAIIPHSQISIIADWTGFFLNAGVSVVPLRRYPVSLTAGVVNVTGALDQDSRFAGGIGYTFQY